MRPPQRERSRTASAALLVLCVLALASPDVARAGLNVWTSQGPEGGDARALAVDPKTTGVVFAATPTGAFKTSTAGSFWSPIKAFVGLFTTSLAIDTTTPATIYAGTGAGVRKSTDGGATWAVTALTGFVVSVAVDPKSPSIVYAGTVGDGVFKSTNAGSSWSPINSGLTNLNVASLAIDPQTPTTLYAGTNCCIGVTGVFKSTNGGASWSLSLAAGSITALAIDPQAPATVYAVGGGLFKTTNAGGTWASIGVGIQEFAVAIDPLSPATIYLGTAGGVFKSTNGGASFVQNTLGLTNPSVRTLALDPQAPLTVYAGLAETFLEAGGIFKSTDGGSTWARTITNLTAVSALQPVLSGAATLYASAYKSTDGGASWNRWITRESGLPPDGYHALTISPADPNVLYALASVTGSTGTVFKSTNGGLSWSRRGAGLPERINFFTYALAIDPQTATTLYVSTVDGVFKTTDGGDSWRPSNAGLPPSPQTVARFAIDPKTPATLYAAMSSGGVFKSTNGGGTWTASGSGLPASLPVFGLAIDPKTPSTLYAGAFVAGVFKSTNGGASWSSSSAGLANTLVRALAVDPQTPSTLYVGGGDVDVARPSFDNVSRSTDGGATWQTLTSGLGSFVVFHFAINPAGTCIHAGTDGGVFDFATQATSECPAPPTLVSAVLPASRSVAVGSGATAFATVINAGSASFDRRPGAPDVGDLSGLTCGITQLTGAPTPFTFQATDPATNQPVGAPNTPVDIGPGASGTFVMSLTPTEAFCPLDVRFGFNCTNTELASIVVGLNTLLLTASSGPVPDMIALAATPTSDGYVTLPGPTGTGFFALATTNVGVAGTIEVATDTGNASMPLTVTVCPTNPTTGACLAPPAPTITLPVAASATPTFAAFVSASGPIADDPAANRIFVRFKDATLTTCGGVSLAITRGSTSVAVRTQ